MKLRLLFTIIFVTQPIFTNNFKIRSIYDLMLEDSNIKFYKCHDPIPFEYKPFPIAEHAYWHPNKGCFDQSGIFIIPYGKAHTSFCLGAHNQIIAFYGSIIYDQHNNLIRELLGTHHSLYRQIEIANLKDQRSLKIKKISGKVAVITDLGSEIYTHWLMKILAKIALLKIKNIEYDWIYILHNKPHMKETLYLLGIDSSKIITPIPDNEYIQADELIVPSIPARFIPMQHNHNYANEHFMTLYTPQWQLNWLREIFIPMLHQHISHHDFSDKIFLSRKDAARNIINEDEIFKFFEQKGFKRYTLSNLSFLEQVALFNQARYIIGTHGSNLANIIFSNQDTCIIELFQNQFDCTFWYLSQQLKLQHHCIKTMVAQPGDRYMSTYASMEMIKDYIIKNLPEL